jgi:hypothetical protein
MDYNSLNFTPLFEKSLVKVTAEFHSAKSNSAALESLSKDLKRKVNSSDPSSMSFQLKRDKSGKFTFTTGFLLYKDARLTLIDLFRWMERNAKTERTDNLYLDLKFIDSIPGPFKGTLFNTSTKIDSIDKIKFILRFDEDSVYKAFPSRKNGFNSQTIRNFIPQQKFLIKSKYIDPTSYDVPNTVNAGVNFETLTEGFVRLQYIGGTKYEEKSKEILDILNQFTVICWDSVINRAYTKDDIDKFKSMISKTKGAREAYLDYALFAKNFPKVKFTVDLLNDKKMIESYYGVLRDRIYEIFTNITIEGECDLNYDSLLCTFQIRSAKFRATKLSKIDFIDCEIMSGSFESCDFYDCQIIDSSLENCNLFLHSIVDRSNILNSFSNRTVQLKNCEIDGMNNVINCDVSGGTIKRSKIGEHAKIEKDVTVIEYSPIKSGYFVAGDKVIIPTKKYNTL